MGAVAAGAATGGVIGATPAGAAPAPASAPTAKLGASAAVTIDASQFMPVKQLAAYGAEANKLGLRATGAANTEAYISMYAKRLKQVGVQDVRLEPVPMKQWLATGWSLTVNGATVPNTFYAPYTRATGPGGVSAELVYVDLNTITTTLPALLANKVRGKIAVFTVSYTALPIAAFAAVSYPLALQIAPGDESKILSSYNRPWLNNVIAALDALAEAGAVGIVGVWPDLPGHWARQYTPYDGVFRPVPALWVDSIEGAKIKALAKNGGAKAKVVLQATVRTVTTNNVVGFIPGRSKELTILHTHTDGTNAMEENGQIGILAAAQYLARLPKSSLERTVMIFLSTGHFAGGVGIRHWLKKEANGLVPKVSSLLTLEHLGCLEFLPGDDGSIRATGKRELGAYFGPSSKGLITASTTALRQLPITGTVARPFLPAQKQPAGATEPLQWPGEGTYFYTYGGGLRDTNFITGPYGLITADLDTTGMVDYDLLRTKAMVGASTILQLAATSNSDLSATAL